MEDKERWYLVLVLFTPTTTSVLKKYRLNDKNQHATIQKEIHHR